MSGGRWKPDAYRPAGRAGQPAGRLRPVDDEPPRPIVVPWSDEPHPWAGAAVRSRRDGCLVAVLLAATLALPVVVFAAALAHRAFR